MITQSSFALALAGIGFLITVIWGGPVVRMLRHFKISAGIQVVSAQGEFVRRGTPTMGGILIILPVALLTVLLNSVSLLTELAVLGRSILLPLGTMIAFAVLGSVSDWRHLKGVRRGGLRARTKFAVQLILAAIIALGLWRILDVPEMYFPFYRGEFELGWYFVPAAVFVIVGTTNGINLTSGIDGMTGLISATTYAAYGTIAILQGQIFLARFCFTVVGAILGFLWFNVHPASLLLGNTGTFALGATLAVVALMTAQWPLLPLIAAIPFAEALSVMLQVGYFRLTGGMRILRMAPLHYHFELSGWSETQILQRFWLINFLFAMIGVTLALV